jgi:hypothetical protein
MPKKTIAPSNQKTDEDFIDLMQHAFRLKRPCADCPFLKVGAISLMPGRLDGIKQDLLENDKQGFPCHKTTHSPRGGEFDDEGEYKASGHESMCAGAAAFLIKQGRPTVAMRMAAAFGAIEMTDWDQSLNLIAD